MRYRLKPNPADTDATLGRADENRLQIRVDTREQRPLQFDKNFVSVTRGTVPVFDYALEGDENNFSIERKSLADFIQAVTLSDSWRRELVKIEKARERLLPVIYVIEASFSDVLHFDFAVFSSGHVTSQFVYRRFAELTYLYHVTIIWAGCREAAEYVICLILKRRWEELRQIVPEPVLQKETT